MASTAPSDSERIRYILGAVGALESVLTDAEIDDALALYEDWRLAGAYIADSLASRAINDPNSFTLTGTLSVSWGDRAKMWQSQAKTLRDDYRASETQEVAMGLQVVELRRQMYGREPAEYTRPRNRRWFD